MDRKNYVRLEFALNTPLKCKIMIFKIRKNKKTLEKFLESLFDIMNPVIDIYFYIINKGLCLNNFSKYVSLIFQNQYR